MSTLWPTRLNTAVSRVTFPIETWGPQGTLPEHIVVALSRADVVVLFATYGGHYLEWVNSELRASEGKRILALVEPGIPLQGTAAHRQQSTGEDESRAGCP